MSGAVKGISRVAEVGHRRSWPEMRAYWEEHSRRWSHLDCALDPDGLGNVCHAGEGAWVNRYYARFQRAVYEWLLTRVTHRAEGFRALDVGCGAGRWCRMLAKRGYKTTGIDLQPELLENSRRRFPEIEFLRCAIQDFTSPERFDLISSVTVLQHLPSEEQIIAVRKMRELTKDGGYLIALENVADQGQHVFANSIERWRTLFGECSFRQVAMRRYDYSPMTRSLAALRRWRRRNTLREAMEPSDAKPMFRDQLIRDALTWMGVKLDSPIEAILVRCQLNITTVHCGFLFEAS